MSQKLGSEISAATEARVQQLAAELFSAAGTTLEQSIPDSVPPEGREIAGRVLTHLMASISTNWDNLEVSGQGLKARSEAVTRAVLDYACLLLQQGYSILETTDRVCLAIDAANLDPSKFPTQREVISDRVRRRVCKLALRQLTNTPLGAKTLERLSLKIGNLVTELLIQSWFDIADETLVTGPDCVHVNVNIGRPVATLSVELRFEDHKFRGAVSL